MAQFETYTHHGAQVAVRSDLKGQHRDYCLCHRCLRLNLDDPARKCKKANLLYAFCVAFDMTTPVWECPDFAEDK